MSSFILVKTRSLTRAQHQQDIVSRVHQHWRSGQALLFHFISCASVSDTVLCDPRRDAVSVAPLVRAIQYCV